MLGRDQAGFYGDDDGLDVGSGLEHFARSAQVVIDVGGMLVQFVGDLLSSTAGRQPAQDVQLDFVKLAARGRSVLMK